MFTNKNTNLIAALITLPMTGIVLSLSYALMEFVV
jgi:hypothetical protein